MNTGDDEFDDEYFANYEKQQHIISTMADRNLRGIELEKLGEVDGAVALYEQNLAEGFDGSHPYTRLAIIYKKLKKSDDEIRVLKQAIKMYTDGNYDLAKRDEFQVRLDKALSLLEV